MAVCLFVFVACASGEMSQIETPSGNLYAVYSEPYGETYGKCYFIEFRADHTTWVASTGTPQGEYANQTVFIFGFLPGGGWRVKNGKLELELAAIGTWASMTLNGDILNMVHSYNMAGDLTYADYEKMEKNNTAMASWAEDKINAGTKPPTSPHLTVLIPSIY
jgi:hypothetical protein